MATLVASSQEVQKLYLAVKSLSSQLAPKRKFGTVCLPAISCDHARLSAVVKCAWVFQELVLAPRTVYFRRSELT